MDHAIVTEQLSKVYPARRSVGRGEAELPATAVDAVSLAVGSGELFGLLGPNGAGKTTLVKMLCTLITPSSGAARIAGHDLADERAIRALSGLVVSDERSFYWRLSARRNLQFFAALHGLHGRAAAERIAAVLDDVGLSERAGQRFSDLSSGMRQRLAIARALLHEPRVLFLDEPTRSLDPVATTAIHALIRSLQASREITILLITHDLSEAEKMCARVALLHEGRLRKIGSPLELRRELDPRRQYLLQVRHLPASVETRLRVLLPDLVVRPERGTTPISLSFRASEQENTLTAVFDILRQAGLAVNSIEGGPPTLEEVFAHYTSGKLGDPA